MWRMDNKWGVYLPLSIYNIQYIQAPVRTVKTWMLNKGTVYPRIPAYIIRAEKQQYVCNAFLGDVAEGFSLRKAEATCRHSV